MTATIVSLLAVTIAFIGLLVWVFWPSHRQRLEAHGEIPFADDRRVPFADDSARDEGSNR